jgi:uncharacterized protein (TIGR00725 family)
MVNRKYRQIEIGFSDSEIMSVDIISDNKSEKLLQFKAGDKIELNTYFLGADDQNIYSIYFFKSNQKKKIDHITEVWFKNISNHFFIQKIIVGVIGCREGSDKFDKIVSDLAFEAGRMIAGMGFITLTGGLSGVMSRAHEGAKKNHGQTLGILTGSSKQDANPYVDIVIPSGIGIARNYIIAQAADLVLALKGGTGTLEEICYSLDFNKQVYSLNSWTIPGVMQITDLTYFKSAIETLFFKSLVYNLNQRWEKQT